MNKTIITAAFGAILTLGAAQAATISWIGGTDTDWGTAANWNSATVPAVGDDVTIGTGFTVNKAGTIDTFTNLTVDFGATLNFTSTSGNLDDGSQTLNIDGAITMAGAALGLKNDTTFNFGSNALMVVSSPLWPNSGSLNVSMVFDLQSDAAGTLVTHDYWTWTAKRTSLDLVETFTELNGVAATRIADNTTPTNQGDYSLFFNDAGVGGIGIQYVTTVPEPSSAALLGLGGFALILRRRK